jgi:hypothetical protein|tara:strand:+ start:492 stop:668 length:177 start_codon:yes stop_codon:yes gene_type:complete
LITAFFKHLTSFELLITAFRKLKIKIMAKSKDSRKNVKKESAKTPKEKKAAKRLKKSQ